MKTNQDRKFFGHGVKYASRVVAVVSKTVLLVRFFESSEQPVQVPVVVFIDVILGLLVCTFANYPPLPSKTQHHTFPLCGVIAHIEIKVHDFFPGHTFAKTNITFEETLA